MRIALPEMLRVPSLLGQLFEATVHAFGDPVASISGISTSSDEVEKGDLFLALKGERTDGHFYLQEALEKGAAGILVCQDFALPQGDFWCLRCKDTARALLKAGGAYRRTCDPFVIAVTGSAGKTTTKEGIAAVLGEAVRNEGNYNSTVGMPLSLLSFPKADFWVSEIGINHPGEMGEMSECLRPDLAVITNVGSAHIGHFGNYTDLLKEKFSVTQGMSNNGVLLLPHELKNIDFSIPLCRILSFGTENTANFCMENILMREKGVICDLRTKNRVITNLSWPIAGRIGLSVIGAVGAVGVLCGRDDRAIRIGLEKAASQALRMKPYMRDDRFFLEDCYNASPEACVAAIESLHIMAAGRPLVAVLGDMLELGEHSRTLHRALGYAVARMGVTQLFTYGCAALDIARGAVEAGLSARRLYSFGTGEYEALAEALLRDTPTNAAILLKASHAMHLERVMWQIRGKCES